MFKPLSSRIGTSLLTGACALVLATSAACAGRSGGKQSSMAKWMKDPSTAVKKGVKLYWEELGVTFEQPDTLYVFRNCGEASHGPDDNGWIPIVACSSVATSGTGDEIDEFAEEASETISVTFYITEKTRPLDERTVSWFENQYKQAGFEVDDISFQHDFQNKSGIYVKLQALGGAGNMPTREIIQFMFPKRDVVFIARVEYPFGDSRSIDGDWKYLLWNFEIDPDLDELEGGGGGDGGGGDAGGGDAEGGDAEAADEAL